MPNPPVHRAYQGESAEARIESRRRRLLDVAFERLATEGRWRETSIARLCREAELNKRYFYESFPDLDAVAGAVTDDLADRLLEVGHGAVAEAMARGLDTPALARHVLGAAIDWLADDPRRATTLFATGADHPHTTQRRNEVIAKLADALHAFSLVYHRADGPLPIARIGSALLVGGTIQVLLAYLGGQLPVSRDELVQDLAQFWVSVGDGAITLTKERLRHEATTTPEPPR